MTWRKNKKRLLSEGSLTKFLTSNRVTSLTRISTTWTSAISWKTRAGWWNYYLMARQMNLKCSKELWERIFWTSLHRIDRSSSRKWKTVFMGLMLITQSLSRIHRSRNPVKDFCRRISLTNLLTCFRIKGWAKILIASSVSIKSQIQKNQISYSTSPSIPISSKTCPSRKKSQQIQGLPQPPNKKKR